MRDVTPSTRPEPAVTGRTAQILAIVAIVVSPSLYSFEFASFTDPKLACWVLAAILLSATVPNLRSAGAILLHRFGPLCALFLASIFLVGTSRLVVAADWAGAVARYAKVADYSLAPLATIALLLVAAALTASAWEVDRRDRILMAIAASGLPVAALGLLQFAGALPGMFPVFAGYDQRVYSVFGNQDLFGGYLAITLALGLALGLTGTIPRSAVWAGASILVPALLVSGSRSAWVAAAAGSALAVIQHRPHAPRLVKGTVYAMMLIGLTAAIAPGATLERALSSFRADDIGYRARLWIWDGTARMIGEHVWLGVGPGNFQYYSPLYLGEAIRAQGPGGHYYNRVHTLHAHSDYLELVSEAGVLGAAAVVAFLALLPRVRHAAWAGLATGLVFSLMNTTVHSPPHIVAMLLSAVALPAPVPHRESRIRSGIGIRAVLVAATSAVSVAVVSVVLIPSYLIAQAETTLDSKDPSASVAAYLSATRMPAVRFDALRALAILEANAGRFGDAQHHVESALRGLDTGDVHYLAGFIAETQGDTARAATEYEACNARWPNHVRAWEGRLRLATDAERDELLTQALPWLAESMAQRLRSLRERLRTEPVPHSAGAGPEA